MIVTREQLTQVVGSLSQAGFYGVDTETYGVDFHDRLFSIIIASENDTFYFNFNSLPDNLGNLPPEEYNLSGQANLLGNIFGRSDSLFFLHNAKFDLQKLRLEGLEIAGRVHCTMAVERLVYNHYLDHSLEACAKRRGLEKDSAVEDYIKKYSLYDEQKKPLYSKVPFYIMANYGQMDARLAYQIGMDQRRDLDVVAE